MALPQRSVILFPTPRGEVVSDHTLYFHPSFPLFYRISFQRLFKHSFPVLDDSKFMTAILGRMFAGCEPTKFKWKDVPGMVMVALLLHCIFLYLRPREP
jgi:hypothetical protein